MTAVSVGLTLLFITGGWLLSSRSWISSDAAGLHVHNGLWTKHFRADAVSRLILLSSRRVGVESHIVVVVDGDNRRAGLIDAAGYASTELLGLGREFTVIPEGSWDFKVRGTVRGTFRHPDGQEF
ncbi:MAG: hypothetical protein ACR2MY_02660 [Candidatus Dormibacteria bacterium]